MLIPDFDRALDAAREFVRAARRPLILHLSDTDTSAYPLAEALLEIVRPELAVHTGDLADEFKVGRCPDDVPGYRQAVPRLLDMLEKYSRRTVLVKGNNDDFSLLDGRSVEILPVGTVLNAFGRRLELSHSPIPATYCADFALYGHGPAADPRYLLNGDAPDGPVYLNGNFHWTIIEAETGRFVRIPCREAVPCMRLFIARHGQVISDQLVDGDPDLPMHDPAISLMGRRQARYLAEELVRSGFSGRIVSSPFTRTLMTAQPIAQAVGSPIYPEPAFREIVMKPEWIAGFVGKTLDEMREMFPEIAEDAVLPYPWWRTDVETHEDVTARVAPLIDSLIARGEDVLLMGHGASTSMAVKYMMLRSGLDFNNFMPCPSGGNCALSEFRIVGNKVLPVRVYSVSHMPLTMASSNANMALNPKED